MKRYVVEYKNLMEEWNWEKNNELGFFPDKITHGSVKKAYWICIKTRDHKWASTINNRTNGNGCPYCTNKKINKTNNLFALYPNLKKEWNFEKNNKINLFGNMVSYGSKKKVFWICQKNKKHKWKATINSRTSNHGCPFCRPNTIRIEPNKSLFILYPDLKHKWNFKKNDKIQLFGNKISAGSDKKAYWTCPKNNKHIWLASINSLTRNPSRGCPYCAGYKINNTNCLFTTHPKLKKEWNFEKNNKIGLFGDKIPSGTRKKAHWKCLKNKTHRWQAAVHNRKKTGCPFCARSISYKEIKWLNFLKIKPAYRQLRLKNVSNFKVDGFDPQTNTVYEFYGDFWHGNPKIYNSNNINAVTKTTFGELYQKTLKKETALKQAGYDVVSIWESEWDGLINRSDS